MNILIAGVGNVLRGDDAFGIRVLDALAESGKVPDGVDLYEAGIAGIALVQELMNGYDALVVIDAVDKGAMPGTLFVLEPTTADADNPIATQEDATRLHQSMVDAHYADPSKVLILARALNVCPTHVFILGCQPACLEEPIEGLDPAVERAVPVAVERVLSLIETLKQTTLAPQG
jgi:hydrogenase maturation protease